MDFFENEENSEESKRDIAFQTLVSIRDVVSIAQKKQQPPTYEQAFRLLYDLDEELYNEFDKILSEKNDNDIVKLYKEEALLQSNSGNKIEPAELIEKEIDRLKGLKKQTNSTKEQTKYINRRISQLYGALENLKPRHLTENAILVRDFAQLDRSKLFGEKIFEDYKFVDYALPSDRFLRLRLLHPDKEEHITGADLIYEQYNVVNEQVRFLFLQYKTWQDGVIYFSQHQSLKPQLVKLQNILCNKSYCKEELLSTPKFRFPCCSGFLRPTDKLQRQNSKMVSSGIHIPVCKALEIAKTNSKIEKRSLAKEYPNHYIFERLFNLGLVGSKWFDLEDVESFYKEQQILQESDTLKIYAREFINSKESSNDFDDDFVL